MGAAQLDHLAAAAEDLPQALLAFRGAEVHVDQPHRLLGVAAFRAGDAGDGQADGGAGQPARPGGHLGRRRLGNGAVPLQRLLAHAQQAALDAVGIGDHPAQEDLRAAGDRGDQVAQPAAGAALGDGQGEAALPEHGHDHLGQADIPFGEDEILQALAHLFGQFVGQAPRLLVGVLGAPQEVQLDHAGRGQDGGDRVAVPAVDVGAASVGLRFADAGQLEGPGVYVIVGRRGDELLEGVLEHRQQLVGRPGQQQHLAAAGVAELPRGGPHPVGQHLGALDDERLAGIDLGHGHAAAAEALPQFGDDLLAEDQFFFQRRRHRLAGDVVLGGAQAAAEHDQLGALARLPDDP